MYEMQGPHMIQQAADLPISQLPSVWPDRTSCPAFPHNARSPGLRTTLGVASEVACCLGGE